MTKKKDPTLTNSEALRLAWKNRADYKGYDKSKGSLFNSWRAIVHTQKGKMKGYPEKWRTFMGFSDDVGSTWQRGYVLCRKDSSQPYSVKNCEWRPKGEEGLGRFVTLEYNGETKTLIEWCSELGLNYNGVRQRYFKGKGYTAEQILYGKDKRFAGVVTDILELDDEQLKRNKVSKMLSQYRLKDKRKGFDCDITPEWFYKAIHYGKCAYCGDTHRLGLDRIDNTKGHTMDNVVVCCYECNCARNSNFSYEEMLILGKTIKEIKDKRNENDN